MFEDRNEESEKSEDRQTIAVMLGELGDSIDRLENRTMHLFEHLDVLLLPAQDNPNVGATQPSLARLMSPMQHTVDSYNDRLLNLVERIREIDQRLDV